MGGVFWVESGVPPPTQSVQARRLVPCAPLAKAASSSWQ
jgi:hypothetical protein